MKPNHNSNPFNPFSGFEHNHDDEEIKFNLFVQSRRVKQFNQALKRMKNKAKPSQASWVFDHSELLDEVLNSLLDDSLLMLDGLELDPEAIDLSLQLVDDIRQTLESVHHLLSDEPVSN